MLACDKVQVFKENKAVAEKKAAKKNPWRSVEGFWIGPTGSFRQVTDHFSEVKGDPNAFGIAEDEVRTWSHKDREQVLTAVMRHGFVRVRGHKDYTTFELWKVSDRIVGHLKAFVDKFSFYPDEEVSIHEISSHKAWNGTIRKLKYLSVERFDEAKTA